MPELELEPQPEPQSEPEPEPEPQSEPEPAVLSHGNCDFPLWSIFLVHMGLRVLIVWFIGV